MPRSKRGLSLMSLITSSTISIRGLKQSYSSTSTANSLAVLCRAVTSHHPQKVTAMGIFLADPSLYGNSCFLGFCCAELPISISLLSDTHLADRVCLRLASAAPPQTKSFQDFMPLHSELSLPRCC